jgi:hypothetical protein
MSDTQMAVDTWQLAEVFAAAHMNTLGFLDAATTPAGADGGVDVVASDAVGQVKHQSTSVGAPVVQQLAGIAHTRGLEGIVYSLSGFTRAAVSAGEDTKIALFSYSTDGATAAWTSRARELAEFGYTQLPAMDQTLAFEEFWVGANCYAQRVADMVPVMNAVVPRVVEEWRAGSPPENIHELTVVMSEVSRMLTALGGDGEREMRGRSLDLLAKIIRWERLMQRAFSIMGVDYREAERGLIAGQARP